MLYHSIFILEAGIPNCFAYQTSCTLGFFYLNYTNKNSVVIEMMKPNIEYCKLPNVGSKPNTQKDGIANLCLCYFY